MAHSAAVEGLHPGLVRAVEVEAVHRADGLRPHVDLLQRHAERNNDAGLADLLSRTPSFYAASVAASIDASVAASQIWQIPQPRVGEAAVHAKVEIEPRTQLSEELHWPTSVIRTMTKLPVCFHHLG